MRISDTHRSSCCRSERATDILLSSMTKDEGADADVDNDGGDTVTAEALGKDF
jgi:hypothetical protein